MNLEKWEAQKERITQIAGGIFPGCLVHFGTQEKPMAMQFWIVGSDDRMLCELPGLTEVTEVEGMSDEQIEARIRGVSIRKPVDSYTLVLEFLDDVNPQQVRAMATRPRDGSSIHAWISFDQTRSLLGHAYGGEQSIVDEYMEQLRENHVVELMTNATSHCSFTRKELLQFGFNLDDLKH